MVKMRKDFPKAKRWLEWWQASDIQSMLFKSRRKQIDDDDLCDDVMPATTNAQESMHRVYYMISYVFSLMVYQYVKDWPLKIVFEFLLMNLFRV